MTARATSPSGHAETVDRQNGTPAASAARRLHFAASGVEAREADRAERERERDAPAKKVRRQVNRGHIPKHALSQLDRLQVSDVPRERRLRVRAAVQVVKQEAR